MTPEGVTPGERGIEKNQLDSLIKADFDERRRNQYAVGWPNKIKNESTLSPEIASRTL